jgi:hypothetical protein
MREVRIFIKTFKKHVFCICGKISNMCFHDVSRLT